MANFEIFAKGPPFALWPKLPILGTLQKNCHFSASSCCFIEILVSRETRINSASIHTNQAKTRLVVTILQPFKVRPKKWPISRFCPPFALWPKLPIFGVLPYCSVGVILGVLSQITFIELAMSSEGSERSSRYLCFARLIYHEMIPHLWFLSKAFLYSPVQLNDASLGAICFI